MFKTFLCQTPSWLFQKTWCRPSTYFQQPWKRIVDVWHTNSRIFWTLSRRTMAEVLGTRWKRSSSLSVQRTLCSDSSQLHTRCDFHKRYGRRDDACRGCPEKSRGPPHILFLTGISAADFGYLTPQKWCPQPVADEIGQTTNSLKAFGSKGRSLQYVKTSNVYHFDGEGSVGTYECCGASNPLLKQRSNQKECYGESGIEYSATDKSEASFVYELCHKYFLIFRKGENVVQTIREAWLLYNASSRAEEH